MTDTYAFIAITKSDKQPDGTLYVEGIATDPSLDIDEQICDPDWLKSAMPDWFKWGNVREQHSATAAGIATEHEELDGARHRLRVHVVDPGSVKKVEAGVLKGFSIGVRNPRVTTDKAARGGRIVGGQIVEVSLVDRPANPACTLTLAKAAEGGDLVAVEELKETPEVDDVTKTAKGTAPADSPQVQLPEGLDIAAIAKAIRAEVLKGLEVHPSKAEKKAAKAARHAEKAAAAAAPAPAADPDPAEAPVDPTEALVKALRKDMKSLRKEIRKSASRTAPADGGESTEAVVKALEARLQKVESTPVPAASVRGVTKAAAAADQARPGDVWRAKAAEAGSDRTLIEGYLKLAADEDARATRA